MIRDHSYSKFQFEEQNIGEHIEQAVSEVDSEETVRSDRKRK
jgi:hypothetical protein